MSKSFHFRAPHTISLQSRRFSPNLNLSATILLQRRDFSHTLHLSARCFRHRSLCHRSEYEVRIDESAPGSLESQAEAMMASKMTVKVKTEAKMPVPTHKKGDGNWSDWEIFGHGCQIVLFRIASFFWKMLKDGEFKYYWPNGLGKLNFVKGEIVKLHFSSKEVYQGVVKERGDLFRNTVLENYETKTTLSLSTQFILSDCKVVENLGRFWRWEHLMGCMGLDNKEIQVRKLIVCKALDSHHSTVNVMANTEPGSVKDRVRETMIRCSCNFIADDWETYDRIKGELRDLLEPWDPQSRS